MALPWSCHLCPFHTWWLWGRAVLTWQCQEPSLDRAFWGQEVSPRSPNVPFLELPCSHMFTQEVAPPRPRKMRPFKPTKQ